MNKLLLSTLSRALLLAGLVFTGLLDSPSVSGSVDAPEGERDRLVKILRGKIGQAKATREKFLDLFAASTEESDKLALAQWFFDFKGSSFSRTSTGRALSAYLLFKNGLETHGVETLFENQEPKAVNKELRKLWKKAAPFHHPVWSLVKVDWSPAWTRFFHRDIEFKVKSNSLFKMSKKELSSLLRRNPLESSTKNQLKLQLALNMAAEGKRGINESLKILERLSKISRDDRLDLNLVFLTIGRLSYSQGLWDKAVKSYRRVSKSSEYWFTAQEELAWTYMIKGEPQNAGGITHGLMLDGFSAHIGPETLLLNALSQLRTCDYFGVADTIDIFKNRFKKRAKALMQVKNKGQTQGVRALLREFKQGREELLALGSRAMEVPRYVSRDQVLLRQIQIQRAREKDLALGQELRARVLSLEGVKTNATDSLNHLLRLLQSRVEKVEKRSLARIQKWAREELVEIKQVLEKMHILEVDWIQKVTSSMKRTGVKVASAGGKVGRSSRQGGTYDLRFPFTGEVWLDELNHYRLDTKGKCAQKGGLR